MAITPVSLALGFIAVLLKPPYFIPSGAAEIFMEGKAKAAWLTFLFQHWCLKATTVPIALHIMQSIWIPFRIKFQDLRGGDNYATVGWPKGREQMFHPSRECGHSFYQGMMNLEDQPNQRHEKQDCITDQKERKKRTWWGCHTNNKAARCGVAVRLLRGESAELGWNSHSAIMLTGWPWAGRTLSAWPASCDDEVERRRTTPTAFSSRKEWLERRAADMQTSNT